MLNVLLIVDCICVCVMVMLYCDYYDVVCVVFEDVFVLCLVLLKKMSGENCVEVEYVDVLSLLMLSVEIMCGCVEDGVCLIECVVNSVCVSVWVW